MGIKAFLTSIPALVTFLGVVLRIGLAWQTELSWPEYHVLHGLKRKTFPAIHKYNPVRSLSFINDKRGRTDDEYQATVERAPKQVAKALRKDGARLHLIASLKRRPSDHGDRTTAAQLIYRHGDDQTEIYLFSNDDGTTDVYAHYEPSPEQPVAHLGHENQTDGDPKGVLDWYISEHAV